MILTSARAKNFKSIKDTGVVDIAPSTTVLVGKNESGKTGFLEALHKAYSQRGIGYSYVDDYPRRQMTAYRRRHEKKQYDQVATLTYAVPDDLVAQINEEVFAGKSVLPAGFTFSTTSNYGNGKTVSVGVDEKAALDAIRESLAGVEFQTEVFEGAEDLDEVLERIKAKDLSDGHELLQFQQQWDERLKNRRAGWGAAELHVWRDYLSPNIPKFLYFDDYCLLPGKVNLKSLKSRMDDDSLEESDETVLGLFDLADITIDDVLKEQGYEELKAQLEAIGLHISDKVFRYWKQNTELDVEFDLKADPHDVAPFDDGVNLYIRIKSRRHGVTIPFDQRSKGFIWFFSFMVWFDAVNEREGTDKRLILLLDEPGLSLHAMAQKDFLAYIDDLAESYQTIFTTHSPFMVDDNKLDAVRVVEDNPESGTTVTSDIAGSGREAIFPLQAALGYDIAQNLFVGKKNLLVEGISDLIVLQHLLTCLESMDRAPDQEWVTVPVGGLEKVATFVALLGANQLDLAVLHDNVGRPEQRLTDLIRRNLLHEKRVFNYSMFCADDSKPADLEDIFTPSLYVKAFNLAYAQKLGSAKLKVGDLGKHPRIIERINEWLRSQSIQLRASGGFNHYLVAQQLTTLIDAESVSSDTWDRIEEMFSQLSASLAA